MLLTWHDYDYYSYERELAVREVAALLDNPTLNKVPSGFELLGKNDSQAAARLTYFADIIDNQGLVETLQSRLEKITRLGKKRQATRYSVHGMHEYKGKFNPQVAKVMLNIFGIQPDHHVLDPFCGSGTTLVECAHVGTLAYGIDINPFAVFLANAKLQALATPASELRAILNKLSASIRRTKIWQTNIADDARSLYLKSWFSLEILHCIEIIRVKINNIAGAAAPVFLAIASNLLRNYSLQDPKDLRIRRRKSPLPSAPFADALLGSCLQSIERIEATQEVLGINFPFNKAFLYDVNTLTPDNFPIQFDACVTSPPYAMALPYIDTQRLSLVWLNLLEPEHILSLEAELIGSRELRGHGRKMLASALKENKDNLPETEAAFCNQLQAALGKRDGFRRQAVPMLLYRYFANMQKSFNAIRSVMQSNAPFALIVGHNHTVLDGIRYNINTPIHLANIASNNGWTVEELFPLQTYHRYGYHMNNAIGAETLVIVRNS